MSVSRVARIVLVAVVLLMGGAALAYPIPTFTETVVAGGPITFPGAETDPEMDGRYVAYEQVPGIGVPGTLDSDIWLYDVGDGSSLRITDDPTDDDIDETSPDISIDTVVYQKESPVTNVFAYNRTWYNTVQITNAASDQTAPRISGRYIIWHNAATNGLMWHAMDTPQYANYAIPGSVGAVAGTWDIDGDTVVFARQTAPGTFDFYKWTIDSGDTAQKFGTHLTPAVGGVRLHNTRIVYTFGAAQDEVGVMSVHDGNGGPLDGAARDADVFHEMYAYEDPSVGWLRLIHNEFWNTPLGVGGAVETDPSVFGNRLVFERAVNGGDIVLTSASEPLIDRSSGDDRYETACAASQEYFRMGANSVVLCTGENFPDALSAAPWARYLKAPLLLTRRTYVPQSVLDEIDRLGATNVWIVGGDAAVAPAVQAQLEAEGLNVDRQLQGVDRYATSKQIAYFLYDAVTGDDREFSGMAFVARGDAFPDALAVAPVAAATYSPVLLVKTNAPLPTATANVLEFLPITEAFIVGGTDVVSVPVEEAIEAWTTLHYGSFMPATRFDGADRYATSASVLGNAVAMNWVDLDAVGIATGLNFPDALGGGAALGYYGSPLLLTKQTSLPASVDTVLTDHAAEIGRVDIFGGDDVVSDGVRTSIEGILNSALAE